MDGLATVIVDLVSYYKYISLWNMEHDTTAAATAAAVRDVGHISP